MFSHIFTSLDNFRRRISQKRIENELATLRRAPRFTPLRHRLNSFELDVADGPSAAAQYAYIFESASYDFPCEEERPIILDCGANIGLGILYWKQRYPQCKIVAFEADPYIFGFLVRNCNAWGFSDVEAVNKALWNSDGSVCFHSNKADGGHIHNDQPTGEMSAIPCTKLSAYLVSPVALLKLDIEGAELEVLEECKDRLNNVERVFVEYHSFVGQPQRLNRLLEILSLAGFRYYIHHEMHSPTPFNHVEVSNGKDLRLNIFAIRAQDVSGK